MHIICVCVCVRVTCILYIPNSPRDQTQSCRQFMQIIRRSPRPRIVARAFHAYTVVHGCAQRFSLENHLYTPRRNATGWLYVNFENPVSAIRQRLMTSHAVVKNNTHTHTYTYIYVYIYIVSKHKYACTSEHERAPSISPRANKSGIGRVGVPDSQFAARNPYDIYNTIARSVHPDNIRPNEGSQRRARRRPCAQSVRI